ncbi:hypothetical protein JQC92_02350 [Shewanella sp. 202IG2-18]|uniref:RyR domain-containing protein n=1 Tax=Parashewanella hymeniacidonis TaxID=2807618 RepID=UPI0019601322|nr:RyR domain-containing protein [Parashewanella hymeniacidonis]MBM7070882.1 hypothetical protein [Parashewanella hymeniacidonis]
MQEKENFTIDDIPAEHKEQIEAIAKVCHEVNRAQCIPYGEKHLSWELAPKWQRDSAILGVCFHIFNPDASASATHESWMAQKLADGWSYGPVKNAKKKTHHCIVPFSDLPKEQQAKDHIFKTIVHQLLVDHQGG